MRWSDAARVTADSMIERFADDERGGFFTTSNDHEEPIAWGCKDVGDHPIPSGSSSAAYGLFRLLRPDRRPRLRGGRRAMMRSFGPAAACHPDAFGHLLQAIDFHLPPSGGRARRPGERCFGRAGLAELAGVVRSAHRPPCGARRRPGGLRAPRAPPASGPPSRASPQPTSASSSPARHR